MTDDGTNFFDESEAEPVADVDSVEQSQVALYRREAAASLLAIITSKATAKQAGHRAFILAHVLKLGTCETQRELAAKLHVSPGRVSQILNSVVRELGL